jgi:U3 small nucleolar RNA-associated protein 22
MAQPVAKRRKLSHSSSSSQSEDGPFAFISDNEESDHTGEEDSAFTESDNEFESQHLGLGEDQKEEDSKTEPLLVGTNGDKAPRRREQERSGARRDQWGDAAFENTAYTGEVFKSNMFKLQVDELLQQLRPKQSQKAPAVKDVLRYLKKIIEDIPSQGPKTVCR